LATRKSSASTARSAERTCVLRPPLESYTIQSKLARSGIRRLVFERERSMDILKVSAGSRTAAVAGAIAGVVREHRRAEVQAIGAGAVNQAVKAIAIARGYLHEDGVDVICIPEFTTIEIEGHERTAMRLTVEPR